MPLWQKMRKLILTKLYLFPLSIFYFIHSVEIKRKRATHVPCLFRMIEWIWNYSNISYPYSKHCILDNLVQWRFLEIRSWWRIPLIFDSLLTLWAKHLEGQLQVMKDMLRTPNLVISPDQTPNVTIRYITLHNLLFLRHSISNGKMPKYIHTIPYHTHIPYIHTYIPFLNSLICYSCCFYKC